MKVFTRFWSLAARLGEGDFDRYCMYIFLPLDQITGGDKIINHWTLVGTRQLLILLRLAVHANSLRLWSGDHKPLAM